MVTRCLGRVVDILEASGAFDPGSSPGRGVSFQILIFPSFRESIPIPFAGCQHQRLSVSRKCSRNALPKILHG